MFMLRNSLFFKNSRKNHRLIITEWNNFKSFEFKTGSCDNEKFKEVNRTFEFRSQVSLGRVLDLVHIRNCFESLAL